MPNFNDASSKPEHRWQNRYEYPGIDAVEEHLEYAVEGDHARRIFGISLGKLVPHDHHGDTPSQADHDQANHVLRIAMQEQYREEEHKHWADNPVLQERQSQHLPIPEHITQFFVSDLCQGRVHHQYQADSDGYISSPGLEPIDERFDARDEVTKQHPDSHSEENPEGKKAVQERQPLSDAVVHFDIPNHRPVFAVISNLAAEGLKSEAG